MQNGQFPALEKQPSVSTSAVPRTRQSCPAPVRVAIYGRVSTSDGRQDVENQLVELRQFAERQGWRTSHEYIDHESGSRSDRAEFRKMFEDAAANRFDLVLVWALDRLTREGVAETFQYIKRLAAHNVQFVSFTEEHFRTTGPAGELMIAVSAWVAQQERQRISERVKASFKRVREKGTKSGQPIGRPKSVFHRDQAIQLRRDGHSWRQISSKLKVGVSTLKRVCRGATQGDQKPGGKNEHSTK